MRTDGTEQDPAESLCETLASLSPGHVEGRAPQQQRGLAGGHQNFLNVTKATDHYGGLGNLGSKTG